MKKTIDQKLHSRKIKKPPLFLYNVLGFIWKIIFTKKYNLKVVDKVNLKKVKGPYILISNHASRQDYIFTAVPLLPRRYNFIAGYNEFFRSHLAGVFKLLKPIPKKNFTPDFYTIKQAKRVVDKGGRLILFPEGMNSIGGCNQPVVVGTGKFVKRFNLPVYYSVIKGGYLTCPKYDLADRKGKVEVTFDQMFTTEDLARLSPTEIEDIMNEKLYHDDYLWNKEQKISYKNDGEIARNLHTLLYWCPKCHSELKMVGKKNTLTCTCCGNGATITDTYDMVPFNEECVIPNTQTEWFKMQREFVKEQIKDPNFKLVEKVKLGMLPKYEYLKDLKTSEIVGEGTITLTHEGLTYDGTKDNEPFNFFIPIASLPTYGMCTDITRFYTFYNGEFVEFYPETESVEKWFLCTEEIHRFNGGSWQDFKF